MKKIKIMLSAIAVLAVVGGALAFKSAKLTFVYCADINHPGAIAGTPTCPRLESTFTITDVNFTSYCTTTVAGSQNSGICELPATVVFKQ